jgi:hypothetical protein
MHYKPWRGLSPGVKPRCQEVDLKKCKNKPQLEQAPWALIHVDGHMADVPWHFLAHREAKSAEQKQCRAGWDAPYLRLIDKGSSGRQLRCDRKDDKGEYCCKAATDFGDGLQIPYGMTRQQPWLKEDADANDSMATVLEINDARVHAPLTCNALVIPPESRIRKGSVVDCLYSSSQKLQQIERAKTPLARKGVLNLIASELRCSVPLIEDALKEIDKGYPLYGQNITQGILLEKEYQALCDEMPEVADDEDFVTRHHTRSWKSMIGDLAGTKPALIIGAVSQLIAVNRIKEIMVLKGFQRMGGMLVPPDIIDESSWLPALELYGEGVFFTLDEAHLKHWEAFPPLHVRAADMQKRFAQFHQPRQCPGAEAIVTPRFLLLHTLAHLLIRQLETEAGYPAASLKERIYCTAGKMPMSGVLVYVAVPDVVGWRRDR